MTDCEQAKSLCALTDALGWALDLLDMYDERLAAIDGRDLVYTDVHVRAKTKARQLLAQETESGVFPPGECHCGVCALCTGGSA